MGTALMPHVEKDGTVTCENFYFAVQSQVLCNVSYEAAVMLRVMKFFCCLFAVFMGFLAVVLQTLGLGLGFVYMSMGIFVGPAVAPAAMAILMEKASATWCTIGAIAGLCGGVTTWIATAQYYRGEVTLATLVDDMPPPIENGKSAAELDAFLVKSYNKALLWANFLFIFLCGLFPFGLYFSDMILSGTAFTIWIAVFGLWRFFGGMSVIILPILDFKKDLAAAAALKQQNAKA